MVAVLGEIIPLRFASTGPTVRCGLLRLAEQIGDTSVAIPLPDRHNYVGVSTQGTNGIMCKCFIKLMPREELGKTTKHHWEECSGEKTLVHSTVTDLPSSYVCPVHACCDTCGCGNGRNQLNIITTGFIDKVVALRCDDCRLIKGLLVGALAGAGAVLTGGLLGHAIAASTLAAGATTGAATGGAAHTALHMAHLCHATHELSKQSRHK